MRIVTNSIFLFTFSFIYIRGEYDHKSLVENTVNQHFFVKTLY